jgi:ABC-type branched-subunit amino acid transport system substrate-binding protein
VIALFVLPFMPGLCNPEKPYSFFFGSISMQLVATQTSYIQKFYPEAKTVVSIMPDLPDSVSFLQAAEKICPRYGLEWLGVEKFPADVTDFMPVITRALAKNPDIIDTGTTGGSMGGLCGLLIKQLRETGFKGFILVPAPPARGTFEQMLPKEYLTKVVTGETDWESTYVASGYRELVGRYAKKFNIVPNPGIVVACEDAVKALLEFINGKDTMDTSVWMEGYAKYRWQSPWGKERYWTGEKMFKINRSCQGYYYVSEYVDGKLDTRWESPIVDELLEK